MDDAGITEKDSLFEQHLVQGHATCVRPPAVVQRDRPACGSSGDSVLRKLARVKWFVYICLERAAACHYLHT